LQFYEFLTINRTTRGEEAREYHRAQNTGNSCVGFDSLALYGKVSVQNCWNSSWIIGSFLAEVLIVAFEKQQKTGLIDSTYSISKLGCVRLHFEAKPPVLMLLDEIFAFSPPCFQTLQVGV